MTYSIPPSGAGIAQLVECQPPMLKVAGSNPVARSILVFTLLLVLPPASADTISWQLRGGVIPQTAPAAAESMISLILMDLGGFEAVSGMPTPYSTPSAAQIAASGAPGAEERLRNKLRSGDRTALMPLVLMLVSNGEIDRASACMAGRGIRLPANRRDLALAASWYGRFSLHSQLARLSDPPPDMTDDDNATVIAAVIAAGWMDLAPDGLFHPEHLVSPVDMASIDRAFPSNASFPPGIIWLDEIDPFFRENR